MVCQTVFPSCFTSVNPSAFQIQLTTTKEGWRTVSRPTNNDEERSSNNPNHNQPPLLLSYALNFLSFLGGVTGGVTVTVTVAQEEEYSLVSHLWACSAFMTVLFPAYSSHAPSSAMRAGRRASICAITVLRKPPSMWGNCSWWIFAARSTIVRGSLMNGRRSMIASQTFCLTFSRLYWKHVSRIAKTGA
jgi:hypothetical protein